MCTAFALNGGKAIALKIKGKLTKITVQDIEKCIDKNGNIDIDNLIESGKWKNKKASKIVIKELTDQYNQAFSKGTKSSNEALQMIFNSMQGEIEKGNNICFGFKCNQSGLIRGYVTGAGISGTERFFRNGMVNNRFRYCVADAGRV